MKSYSTCKIGVAALLMAGVASSATAENSMSFESIATKNVLLTLQGFEFAGGMVRDNSGKSQCKGDEMIAKSWGGSGFIVSPDGTFVTNYHVAAKALKGIARFDDGTQIDIRGLKVYDRQTDLAVMQFAAKGPHSVNILGDSDTVRPLQAVIAVGNPLGEGLNVTKGDVSQVVKNARGEPTLIRHTAPTTDGNSGGALYRGQEVIGVNTATWPGRGFHSAVPINRVKPLLNSSYSKLHPLSDAFPTDGTAIAKRIEYLDTVKTSLTAQGGTIPYFLNDLTDYVFVVQNEQGKDIDLLIKSASGTNVACAYGTNPKSEVLLYSNTYAQEVSIHVVNETGSPTNVTVRIGQINW